MVDNGSTDDTPTVVAEYSAADQRVRLVSAPDRHNLSYARNVGVAAAAAPAVAFCDDDDIVDSGWVNGLCDALDTHPFVASTLEYDRLNSPSQLVGRARFQSTTIERMFGIPVAGGVIGITRSLWNSVGGNDEHFGATGEDFDFAMRVFLESGISPILAERAIYHCRLREGSARSFRQARRYGRSHAQLYSRHGKGRVSLRENSVTAVRDWWWILSRAPLALRSARRQNWATHLGRRIGRLQGSIAFRVLYL